MGLQKRTRDIIDNSVKNRTEFRRGNILGKLVKKDEYPYVGRLPESWTKILRTDIKVQDVYIVYSYQTPIAWYNGDFWVVPDIRYSSSTTSHQNAIRAAIHFSGKEVKSDA